MKNFGASKDTRDNVERPPTGREHVLVHHVSGQGFSSTLHEPPLQLDSQKANRPTTTRAKQLNGHLSKGDVRTGPARPREHAERPRA